VSYTEDSIWLTTFDAIAQAICLLDAEGQLVRFNRAFAERFRADERKIGHRLTGVAGVLARQLPGAPAEIELEAGGRWWRVTADPLQEGGRVLVFGDATGKKRLEEELRRRADQLAEEGARKDEFLAMLAHELRNPLGAFGTALTVLEERGAGDAKESRLRGVCRRQLDHLTRLVDDLLDVSRITRGKVELKPVSLDLVAAVENAVTAVKPLFDVRRHELTVSLPPQPVLAVADPTRIEQVVANLLSNAAKYTPPSGHIALTLTCLPGPSGGTAAIHVADDGVGIQREMLGKIFDLFVQAEPPGRGAPGGLGVGLTLVRALVEMHGGTVEARSAGPGRGATFTVRLPLLALDATPPEPIPAVARDPERTLSLLVIEDQPDVREALTSLLREWGHRVEGVDDGRSGIALAAAVRPDLVFVDIGLPGLDGYEVAKRLRLDPLTAELPLVALTGYGRPEDRARALRAGFDMHLVKPVDAARLRALLAHGVSGPSTHSVGAG